MRIGLIICILALTAGVFFAAIQSLPAGMTSTSAQAATGDAIQEAKLAQTIEENLSLQTAVSELEQKNATLLSQLDGAQSEAEKHQTTIAALEANDALRAVSEADNSALSESLAALQEKLSVTELAYKNIKDVAQAKSTEIAEAQTTIVELEANIAELELAGEASSTRIFELESDLKKLADAEVSEPQSELIAERDSALAELAARILALQSQLAEQKNTIAALNASGQNATMTSAAMCQVRSNALSNAISFKGGSTSISIQNTALLDELTNVVAECVQQDVLLEIEGHTDNSSGAASNLLLSNGRANAVMAFLAERGIPAESMRAVGFGSSDPVADNATAEGRLLNQRIVFDWEAK